MIINADDSHEHITDCCILETYPFRLPIPHYRHIHTGKRIILAAKMMNLQPQCDIEKFICIPFANWTLTRLDLPIPPCSNLTSNLLPSIVAASIACMQKRVEDVVKGGLVLEGTANQIT